MELRGLGESFVRNGSCAEHCSVPDFPRVDLSPWHWLHPFLLKSFCFDGSVSLVLHSVQEVVRMQSALLAPLITTLSFIPLRTKMGKPFLLDLYKLTFFHPPYSALSDLRHAIIKVNVLSTDGKVLGCCLSDNWLLGREVHLWELRVTPFDFHG